MSSDSGLRRAGAGPGAVRGTAPPAAAFPIGLYASFERVSGGLLHVLQGLLWLVQTLLARRVEVRGDLSLLLFLPVYLVYYPARRYLWGRLYRPYGHVEREEELKVLRFQAWWGPGWLSLLALLMHLGTGRWRASIVTVVAWPLVLWVPLLLWGRLSVDLGHYIPQYVLMENASRVAPYVWRWPLIAVIPAAYAVIGLVQHIWFRRAVAAYRRAAGAGGPPMSGPLAEAMPAQRDRPGEVGP